MATIKRRKKSTAAEVTVTKLAKIAEHVVPLYTCPHPASGGMLTVIRSVTLHCTEGSSDKIYEIRLAENVNGTLYEVSAAYGRRGGTLTHAGKGTSLDLQRAQLIFDKLLAKKQLLKGYSIIGQIDNTGACVARASAAAATSGLGPRPPKLVVKVASSGGGGTATAHGGKTAVANAVVEEATHSCFMHGHRLNLTRTGSSSSARTFVTCQYAGRKNGACSLRPYALDEDDAALTNGGWQSLLVGVVGRGNIETLEARSPKTVLGGASAQLTDVLTLSWNSRKDAWSVMTNSRDCVHSLTVIEPANAAHARVVCQKCYTTSCALPDASAPMRTRSIRVVRTEAGCLSWCTPHEGTGLETLLTLESTPAGDAYVWLATPTASEAAVKSEPPVTEVIAPDDVLHACDHELICRLGDNTPYVRCLHTCQSTWLVKHRPTDPADVMLLSIRGSYRKLGTLTSLTLREEVVTEQVGKMRIKNGSRWFGVHVGVSAHRKNGAVFNEKQTVATDVQTVYDALSKKMCQAVDDWREEQKTGGSLFGSSTGMIKRRK